MKKYDEIFDKEINIILDELYHNSFNMGETKIKRANIKTEKRYVDYLEEIKLIKRVPAGDYNGLWGMQLEWKGYEVFEKFDGWHDYKKKVIDKANRVEKAKSMAQRFWWLPIFLSALSLLIAIMALTTKK